MFCIGGIPYAANNLSLRLEGGPQYVPQGRGVSRTSYLKNPQQIQAQKPTILGGCGDA